MNAAPYDPPPGSPAQPLAAGYSVHEFLGRGSSGMVWRATQEGTMREVALKFLSPWNVDGLAGQRFAREAEIAASLEHENIARVFDSGESASGLWLAMELVDGPPADRWVAALNPPLRDRVSLFRKICAGMRHAHQRGVIHRDLKPGNILVAADGTPKVVDFGLACRREGPTLDVTLTRQGEVFGSLAWMAPEQAEGRWSEVDALSDVHSLGAVLYALLSGRPPLNPRLPVAALLAAAQSGERPALNDTLPQVPKDLAAIADKCLQAGKSRRYQSVAALDEDVERWMAGEPVMARSSTPFYWMGKKLRRHRLAATAGLTACLSAGGLAWSVFQNQRTLEKQKQEAMEREAAQTAITLHEAHELVSQLLIELRPLLEKAGHPEWIETAEKQISAFRWDIGGQGSAFDPRRFRARSNMLTASMLERSGQWGGSTNHWRRAVHNLKELVTEHPEAAIFREELAQSLNGEQLGLFRLGFYREAVASGEKALSFFLPAAPGGSVTPANIPLMVEACCTLSQATITGGGTVEKAIALLEKARQQLPALTPEQMDGDQSHWHGRMSRELARLKVSATGNEAAAEAQFAVDCARQASRVTSGGELAARLLAMTLSTAGDIAREKGEFTRAWDLLTEARNALGDGRDTVIRFSLSLEPVKDVAWAWERLASRLELSGDTAKGIAGNEEAVRIWLMLNRQSSSGAASLTSAARLSLQNARLWIKLHQPENAIRSAGEALKRFQGAAKPARANSLAINSGLADTLLTLAELKAPSPAGGPPWTGMADAALAACRQKQATLEPGEAAELEALEQRLRALTGAPPP